MHEEELESAEEEIQSVVVFGNDQAKRVNPAPAYIRQVPLKMYIFECLECHQQVTVTRYPGNTPVVCDACQHDYRLKRNRERVAAYRERKKSNP